MDPLHVPSPLRPRYPRVVLHVAGVVVAGVLAWLLWQGWRQPELILDLAAMRLC